MLAYRFHHDRLNVKEGACAGRGEEVQSYPRLREVGQELLRPPAFFSLDSIQRALVRKLGRVEAAPAEVDVCPVLEIGVLRSHPIPVLLAEFRVHSIVLNAVHEVDHDVILGLRDLNVLPSVPSLCAVLPKHLVWVSLDLEHFAEYFLQVPE